MTQTTSYKTLCSWNPSKPLAKKGLIVAADLTQEWILPWWWSNYIKYNDLPVAFVDLGLSKEMKAWCKEKGHYIHLPIADVFVAEKTSFSQEEIKKWEEEHGTHFWAGRGAWFKKPLACLQTPFEYSVWMDLDCEIKGSLDPIFSLPLPSSGITLAKEFHSPNSWDNVNSGVILFEKGCSLIKKWGEEALENNDTYIGDQDILYSLILQEKTPIGDFPLIYNWSRFNKSNPDAVVVHWHGQHGKSFITHQIQKAKLAESGLLG